jgi:hypothetical protein
MTTRPRRPLRSGLCALAALLLSSLPAVAQPPAGPGAPPAPLPPRPRVAALAISEPIHLDGVLDEAAWQQAEPATGFLQREPATGQPATDNTVVRVAYTRTTLYVAIQAFTDRPEDVVGEEMQRDSQLYRDDSVIVLLDTFHDHRNAYWFETNANGARTDALLTDEGRDFNVQWDGVWDVAARRNAQGWAAEIAIPFTTLRFNPNLDTWGFNVRRLIRYKREEAFWSFIPLQANLFRVSMAGELTGIHPPPPGLNLRLKPFGVAQSTEQTTAAGRKLSDDDADAGMDVKWGLTRTLTLDLTYNTDFAESEVDDQQINLTRFSLFFPEKREFFLENAGIFEFGFNSPGTPLLKPFFSRRLGISPFGTVVPIDWGARLTGRTGPWSLGLLDLETRRTDVVPGFEVPDNNWGVVRLKRNIGRRSTVGLIATNRQSDGDDFNRVFGLDTTLYPTDRLSFSGFYTSSDDPGRSRGQGGSWAGGTRAAWTGPIWNWSIDAVQIGEDYNPEVGFLLRQGIRRYFPNVTYEPRPQIAGVRNLHFAGSADLVTDLDDRIESRTLSADVFGVRFHTEDLIFLFADSSYERVPGPFPIGPGVVIAPGEYDFNDAGVNFATNNSRRLALNGYLLKGQFYDGDRLSHFLNLIVRANRHLRFDTTWVRDDIDLPAGSFVSDILRERIGVAFTPNLSTNAYVQYNDLNDLLSLNLRFNWIYRPGSDIFLVFNQNWNAPSLGNLDRRDRAVILKATYLFEF